MFCGLLLVLVMVVMVEGILIGVDVIWVIGVVILVFVVIIVCCGMVMNMVVMVVVVVVVLGIRKCIRWFGWFV